LWFNGPHAPEEDDMAITLTFEDEEIQVLEQLLKGDHSRLFLEIAHTDHRDYRDYLKKREDILNSILGKICKC
jgi:hypothetical protein